MVPCGFLWIFYIHDNVILRVLLLPFQFRCLLFPLLPNSPGYKFQYNSKQKWQEQMDSFWVSFCTWSEVWAEWSSLCSLLWKMDALLFHHHLLKRLSILHSITFSPLSKIHWSCTCGSISGLCSTDPCLYPFINTTFLHYCSLEILIILALTQKLCKIDIFHVIKMSPMFIIQQLSHTENT